MPKHAQPAKASASRSGHTWQTCPAIPKPGLHRDFLEKVVFLQKGSIASATVFPPGFERFAHTPEKERYLFMIAILQQPPPSQDFREIPASISQVSGVCWGMA